MTTREQRDRARKIELGTSVAAGTVGSALGAAKLRDAFAEEHPQAFTRGEESLARAAGPRVARFLGHAKPGFKPLAAGTALAIAATGANKYRQKQDHALARERARAHQGEPLEKAAPEFKGGWALLRGKRVRVDYYHGNDHFMTIDANGTRRLAHRDHLQWIKPKVRVAKSQDPTMLQQLDAMDSRARKLRAKAIPNKMVIARKVGDAVGDVKDDVQRSMSKAYDPNKGRRRRARAVELGAGGGAVAAGVGAARDRRDAARQFRNSAGNEKAAHTNFRVSRLAGGRVADDLKGYAEKARHGNRPGTPGRTISGPHVGVTLSAQKASYHHLEEGKSAFVRAFHEGREGERLVHRSNRSALAAAGLAAVAVGAHRAANRAKRPR